MSCCYLVIFFTYYSFADHHAFILDFFVKMLLKPSHLFNKDLGRTALVSIRECITRAILRCISTSRNVGLAKSLLFTFLKSFISNSINKWSLINSMNAIVALAKLLKPIEVFFVLKKIGV